MEKAIRTSRALALNMPCAKYELLNIYTARDIAKKGSLWFASNLIISRVYLQCVRVQPGLVYIRT